MKTYKLEDGTKVFKYGNPIETEAVVAGKKNFYKAFAKGCSIWPWWEFGRN